MTQSDRDVVSMLRETIARHIGQQRFDLWFCGDHGISLRNDTVVLGLPSDFYLEWVRPRFRGLLETCCTDVLGRPTRVEFEVHAAPVEQAVEQQMVPVLKLAQPPIPPGEDAVPAAKESARNMPAARRFASLDTFDLASCNQLARGSATIVLDRPGELNPLYVHGPCGVGKSHLLEGIYSAFRSKRRGTGLFLQAEQYTNFFLEALQGTGLPSFRRRYRNLDWLVIDDLQDFEGKPRTVEEFLRTSEILIRAGKQVVLAGDRPPQELQAIDPALQTLVQSGMCCRIGLPDLELRRKVVGRLAAKTLSPIPPEVQEFIAQHVTASLRHLGGAVNRLSATAEALDRPVTLELAEETLGDHVERNSESLGVADIERVVCQSLHLTPEMLQQDRRARLVSHPRMLAMWLARRFTRAPLSEIGRHFGRSHSTVISAQQKIDKLLEENATLRVADRHWPLAQIVRKIEDQLEVRRSQRFG